MDHLEYVPTEGGREILDLSKEIRTLKAKTKFILEVQNRLPKRTFWKTLLGETRSGRLTSPKEVVEVIIERERFPFLS